jgi:hypothetical protein
MKGFVLSVFILALIVSCKKESSFSPIPAIQFEKFIVYNADSSDCIISFQDGDGDIGVLSGDTTPYNLKMTYLHKNSAGNFVPYNANSGSSVFDTLAYTFRIQNITPNGQYKALTGDITVQLRAAPIFNPKDSVVKFAINLWDRAGHESNTVYTNEIHVPK